MFLNLCLFFVKVCLLGCGDGSLKALHGIVLREGKREREGGGRERLLIIARWRCVFKIVSEVKVFCLNPCYFYAFVTRRLSFLWRAKKPTVAGRKKL